MSEETLTEEPVDCAVNRDPLSFRKLRKNRQQVRDNHRGEAVGSRRDSDEYKQDLLWTNNAWCRFQQWLSLDTRVCCTPTVGTTWYKWKMETSGCLLPWPINHPVRVDPDVPFGWSPFVISQVVHDVISSINCYAWIRKWSVIIPRPLLFGIFRRKPQAGCPFHRI